MAIPKMKKNFVIKMNDAKLKMGSLKKAKDAQPEVKEVKAVKGVKAQPAVKAVKEVKDDDGKVITEAVKAQPAVKEVKAVKGVKGKPAVPAQPQEQTVYLISKDKEILGEVMARMADQGFTPELDGQMLEVDGLFRLTYKAITDRVIRDAFKVCKAKDGYNADGLAIIEAEKKKEAKAKKEAEAKAKKEQEAKDAVKAGNKMNAKGQKEKAEKSEEDGWPEK